METIEKKRKATKCQHYILPKKCPYCKKKDIKLMTQIEFYGREYSGNLIYVCQGCKARAGCHNGTEVPFGCLANDELRNLRMKIHSIVDEFWHDQITRRKVYQKLGDKYGYPFHIGFLDNERARWVLYDLDVNKFSKEISKS